MWQLYVASRQSCLRHWRLLQKQGVVCIEYIFYGFFSQKTNNQRQIWYEKIISLCGTNVYSLSLLLGFYVSYGLYIAKYATGVDPSILKKRIQPRINGGWDFNHMSPFKTIGVKKKLNLETSDPLLDLPQIQRGQLKSKNLSQKVQHIFQTNKTHFEKKNVQKTTN